MKHLLLIMSLVTLATTSMAAPKDTHFICGFSNSQNSLSIQFDGPRFVDAVNLNLADEELEELLYNSEKGNEAYNGKISGFFSMGSCRGETLNTLVSCQANPALSLNYSFSKGERLSDDFFETISYQRNLKVKDISMVIKKVNGNAHLDLKMTFSHFMGSDIVTHISRNLGRFDNGPGSCRYSSPFN